MKSKQFYLKALSVLLSTSIALSTVPATVLAEDAQPTDSTALVQDTAQSESQASTSAVDAAQSESQASASAADSTQSQSQDTAADTAQSEAASQSSEPTQQNAASQDDSTAQSQPEATEQVNTDNLPVLLVTELLPDSENVSGSDAYEYIELYNNSNAAVNLKDYKLYYCYPDKGESGDVVWSEFDQDFMLQPQECVVFWIKNGKNDTLTADDFNQKFGTNLELCKNLIELHNAGMANSGARGIRIRSAVGDQIDYVEYNKDGSTDTAADKSIMYRYNEKTGASEMIANNATPSPGVVAPENQPVQATPTTPTGEPVVENMTPSTFDGTQDLTFQIKASGQNTTIKSVTLAIKDNKSDTFEEYDLTRSSQQDVFAKTIPAVDLTGKTSYQYYFVISDGTNTVTTDTMTVSNSSAQQGDLRVDVADGETLTGKRDIITTGSTLTLDGKPLEGGVPSVEKGVKFVFDVTQTDVFFKNAVAIGNDVLGIFDDGTYSNWETIAYDVNPSYFVKGEPIQIDIHAGNKANPLEHNEENNDDFVVKNIRLVLPDGTTLRPAGYDDPEQNINMGDSSGKVEILNAVFNLDDSLFPAVRYAVDTTTLSDGTHELVAAQGDQQQTVSFVVDNTAPDITTNMAETLYKGNFTIEAQAADAVSDVKSFQASLDGSNISLPYSVTGTDLTAGKHTLQLTATDSVGNTSTKTVVFETPEENAQIIGDVLPANGSVVTEDPTFSLTATDPTGDLMHVAFKRGTSYQLGDAQIKTSSGISNAAGTNNTTDFTAESGNGFPFEQFDIQVGTGLSATTEVELRWNGTSNSAKNNLYAYNVTTNQWDLVKTTQQTGADGQLTLEGTVPVGDYVQGGVVKAMVQSGEGYTPTQYAAGTPAGDTIYDTTPTSNPNDLDRNQYDFTFAIESDTQYYNEDSADNTGAIGHFQSQLTIHDWLLANRSRMNIQYLFHDGDIIDDEPIVGEWQNADKAYSMLDNALFPYGILAGNHDVGHKSEDYTSYGTYFGESRYNQTPWYGGSYENNRGHYDLITVDGIDFIMLYMGWGIGDDEIQWMNDVLQQYPDRKAILNFHEYLLASGGLGEEPQRVYDEVVSKNPNVCMVFSGHYHNAQTRVDSFDDDGDGVKERKVYQMLFDYQGLPEGGLGYIRLMHFDMENQQILFKTYSPVLDDYNAKDEPNVDASTIVGEEDFAVSFADLGIVPQTKQLSTSGFTANVYTDEVIGKVDNVQSGQPVSYTLSNAENGTLNWYAEVTDDYNGMTRTDVQTLTVKKSDSSSSQPDDSTSGSSQSTSSGNSNSNSSGNSTGNSTGNSSANSSGNSTTQTSTPQTGDNAFIAPLVTALIASFAAGCATFLKKRKGKEE